MTSLASSPAPTAKSSQVKPAPQELRRRRRKMKETGADRAYTIIVGLILTAAIASIIYPLYFIVIASVSEPSAILNGEVWLWPQGFTLEGYAAIFSEPSIWRGFGNSILYTTLSTAISVSIIICGAYALSRKDLPGRKFFTLLFIITMFVNGGMIARYLVVQNLGMLNTIWAVVLPGAVGVWNLIIARSFFEGNVNRPGFDAVPF